MEISGIFPALITPYSDDGRINAPGTAQLVQALNKEGADGYFVSGSSAECYLLSFDERLAALDEVIAAAEGRTIIFHVGAGDHRETLRLARAAASHGASVVCANIPTYFSYSDRSLADYYRQIRDHTDLPVFAYYIPNQTGRALTADFFLRLAQEGVLSGMKYTSTDFSLLSFILAGLTDIDSFTILGGADEALLPALALGARGGIGSSYNIACRIYRDIYEAFIRGDLVRAQESQRAACDVLENMSGWEFVSFLKAILRSRGYDVGQARAPMETIYKTRERELMTMLGGTPSTAESLIPVRK